MTVTTPERTELTNLDALDFDAPLLCDVNECHRDKINAAVAVAQVTRAQDCCTQTAPSCRLHTTEAVLARIFHQVVSCPKHKTDDCAHAALRIEPLP